MYVVESLTGGFLARFAGLGKARFFAQANRPCLIRNKAGKVINQY